MGKPSFASTAPIVVVLLLGCGTGQPPSGPPSARPADPKELASQLEEAYRTSSQSALSSFFRNWHDSSQPIEDPRQREVYTLFQDYFHPSGLNDIVGDNDYSSVIEEYGGTEYVIVQNTIQYQIGEDQESAKITIDDFRPAVNVGNQKALYLTEPYRVALESFLEAGNPPGDFDVDEELKRVAFLGKYVRVIHGHWSGWDLLTPPSVDLVQFDETFTKATVHFTTVWEGGRTTMKRTDNGWEIEHSGLYWMM